MVLRDMHATQENKHSTRGCDKSEDKGIGDRTKQEG